MTLSTIRNLNLDENVARDLYCQVVAVTQSKSCEWDLTNEEVLESLFKLILDRIADPDPFQSLKTEQNNISLNIYPWFQNLVAKGDDPLYTAVKLAILGNSFDVMVSDGTLDLKKSIMSRLDTPLSREAFAGFKKQLQKSCSIVYFADNAGEVVFDKLLIETIKASYDLEIVVVVRSFPVLNDVTMKEARFVGLDTIVPVMENGIDGPLPGTILGRCSDKVRHLVQGADLVIAKGGANFDTLDEEYKRTPINITYMLIAKCYPYCHSFDKGLNQPILANYYAEERKNGREPIGRGS
jgi:uncharacterized protein with ATP-grasp and redox domains